MDEVPADDAPADDLAVQLLAITGWGTVGAGVRSRIVGPLAWSAARGGAALLGPGPDERDPVMASERAR